MHALDLLDRLRAAAVDRRCDGLDRETVARFVESDPQLPAAIDEAARRRAELETVEPALLRLPEGELIARLLADYVNFYPQSAVSPYVPLSGRGPWIVTSHGAVIHDSGGYGMLGLGHAPPAIQAALSQPHVMANVMTASFSQHRLAARLKDEIGHTRDDGCPYGGFLCLNSGSEAMTLAARISDLHAGTMTAPGARHEGKQIAQIALRGAFHGRTDRPARMSDSTLRKARKLLPSYADLALETVPANDVAALEAAVAEAEAAGRWFECLFLEPVQGEGNPGVGLTPAFYAAARRLCTDAETLLVADSIQAGLRTHGVLSVVDYPGFAELPPPDLESFSKALNAGQFPLSVLAVTDEVAAMYVTGLYGNTMTTNPRALEVACAVLDAITPALRARIRGAGAELLHGFQGLAGEFPGAIVRAQGTGLIAALEMNPETHPVNGPGALEETLRRRGIGVIHGGANALRFTPWFGITSAEIALICREIRAVLSA